MLPKNNRLKKEKDFELVLKTGKSAREGFLLLKEINNNAGHTRFGISISKKISKKATLRNRIKRQIASLLKSDLPAIKKGKDVLLIALSGLEKKNFSEIRENISALFKKAKIIKND
jgi:ribonuclease P protein component